MQFYAPHPNEHFYRHHSDPTSPDYPEYQRWLKSPFPYSPFVPYVPLPDFGASHCPSLCKFLGGMLCPGWCVSGILLCSSVTLSSAIIVADGGIHVPTPVFIASALGITGSLIYSICSGIADVNRDNLNRSALANCIVRVITGGEAIQDCRCPV